jgi:hypothetical protein
MRPRASFECQAGVKQTASRHIRIVLRTSETRIFIDGLVDERGFETPGLLVANSRENKLRQGATIT